MIPAAGVPGAEAAGAGDEQQSLCVNSSMSGFEEWAADYRASRQGSAQILFLLLAGLLEWPCMLSVKEAAREGVWELESDVMLVFLHSQRGDILELFGCSISTNSWINDSEPRGAAFRFLSRRASPQIGYCEKNCHNLDGVRPSNMQRIRGDSVEERVEERDSNQSAPSPRLFEQVNICLLSLLPQGLKLNHEDLSIGYTINR
ncbi:hypothetical protein JOQ06_024987, partial [Pogonophryne albipinna]